MSDKKTAFYGIKLNVKNDADIIEWLDRCVNKQGYIKLLIRDHMNIMKYKREVNIHEDNDGNI